jgi:hypothetical protein
MKLCPDCEFIYEDDQSFCDMDGKELVFDPKPLSFKENALSHSMQLEALVAMPATLAARTGPSWGSGLPPSLPARWESRSLIVAALAGVVIAALLFFAYYVRLHRSRSVNARQSHNQSYDPSAHGAISAQPSTPGLVAESTSSVENLSSEQPPLETLTESPAAEARQAAGLASARTSSGTNHAPVIIQLTNGAIIKADEAWENKKGIWYRQAGVVTFLKRSQVRAIQRLDPPTKSQQPMRSRETTVARKQPVAEKPEATSPNKESRVSSFLKKTGRILKKPFKF